MILDLVVSANQRLVRGFLVFTDQLRAVCPVDSLDRIEKVNYTSSHLGSDIQDAFMCMQASFPDLEVGNDGQVICIGLRYNRL